MRTGRPTADKKDNVIKFRISEEMNRFLENESKKTGKSISETIRCCIEKSM